MRSVSILGSTSTATVCNSQKTGNMIVIAAGRTRRKRARVGFSCDCNVRRATGACSVLGTSRCTTLRGRVHAGTKSRCSLGPTFSSPRSLKANAS